ncbi:MAG: peptide chain release factor 1 [Candidatus Pacebacteria bacterium]|nr:peptide chain release factor 1 [Candidatus Paceibacterota bacterium]
MASIEDLKKEYKELLTQLGDPELLSDWEKFEELNKRKESIEKILEKEEELKEIKNRIEENKAIINSEEGPELLSLAETEIAQLKEKELSLEDEIKKMSSESEEKINLPNAVIVEIRAGAGGDEAALFVGDLYKMYSRYAQIIGWEQKVLDSSPTNIGGFKEIIFELKGPGVYKKMMNEAGVHRVQRIPETEKSGRIHTSTSSVAVLPKPRKTDFKINPADLRIEHYHSSGAGGQYVNKRETAVRIVHIPTGLIVTSQTERNLLQNKENAMSILAARLLERKESEELAKLGGKRKEQIGKAMRAEKIRTYNFPQDRVTDHRVQKSFHNIEGIMAGKLDPIVDALLKETT